MELKEWNELQCKIMKELHMGNKSYEEIYKIGEMIAHLKESNCSTEEKLKSVHEILKMHYK